jgi:hypothetical protein
MEEETATETARHQWKMEEETATVTARHLWKADVAVCRDGEGCRQREQFWVEVGSLVFTSI